MILTCPSCSARYKVDDAAFADKAGRDVRCAKCHHMWRFEPGSGISENNGAAPSGQNQQGADVKPQAKSRTSFSDSMEDAEKSSLNDLINRIQSEEFDEIDFGDGKNNKKTKLAEKTNRKSLVSTVKERIQRMTFAFKRGLAIPMLKISGAFHKFSRVRRVVIGALLGLMLFVASAVTILENKDAIEKAVPATVKIFQFAQLEWTDVPKVKLEDVLVVDHLSLENEISGEPGHEENVDVVKGTLINISQNEVQIPLLTLRMLDQNNLVISEKNVSTGIETLAGEAQADFGIKLKHGELPEGAVKLELFYGVASKTKPAASGANESAEPSTEHELPTPHLPGEAG